MNERDAHSSTSDRRRPLFTDKLSGARSDRPGLAKCLDLLRSHDILVVWRLDRLGRSMQHLITLVEDLRSRGIGFRSLNEGAIDTTSASGELIFNISRSTYDRYFDLEPGDPSGEIV